MLYKAFAAITLIAAPIIVLVVQSVALQSPAPHASSAVQAPVQQEAPMMQPPPSSAAPEPTSDPASFGQPMPDAGKPFLTPGNGLPGTAPAMEGEADNGAAPPDTVSP